MAAVPLAPARRPLPATPGRAEHRARKAKATGKGQEGAPRSSPGRGKPQDPFPRTPLARPEGRSAPQKVHPAKGKGALRALTPKDGRPSPPLATRRPAMGPRCKTGTAAPSPVHRGKPAGTPARGLTVTVHPPRAPRAAPASPVRPLFTRHMFEKQRPSLGSVVGGSPFRRR
jgi:hypothetical protein